MKVATLMLSHKLSLSDVGKSMFDKIFAACCKKNIFHSKNSIQTYSHWYQLKIFLYLKITGLNDSGTSQKY